MSGPEVLRSQGVVRGLKIAESDAAGTYASVRLAGDPSFYKDFDSPESWEGLKGKPVSIVWYWSDGSNGMTYRVIIDVEVLEDPT